MIVAIVGVVVAAIAIGVFVLFLLGSGFLSRYTPIFVLLDRIPFGPRGGYIKGLVPAFHRDEPWGFTFEELSQHDLTGQNIVITGGNAGLGYWSAYHIAKQNANVVIACRSMKKAQAAAEKIKAKTGKEVYPMELDLSSFASIRAFAQEYKEKYETLDSLLANAGVMVPPFSKTKEGFELQIGVNHFGHALLTQELLPLIEAAAEEKGVATICIVSSAAHWDTYGVGIFPTLEEMNNEKLYSRTEAYGQSKTANILFAKELSERLEDKNILVNSIHPGSVATDLTRHAESLLNNTLGESFAGIVSDFIQSGFWSPRDAALTEIYATVGENLKKNKTTGKYFHPIARETLPSKHARSKKLQKSLWKLTEEVLQSN